MAATPFWHRVSWSEGCWEWLGGRSGHGYGAYRGRAAHRAAYELAVGPIPDGMQLDHLCKNRSCVNPAHLEPVTPRMNTLRSTAPSAANAAAVSCKNGHPFDEGNTYLRTRTSGGRKCRECVNAHSRKYYAKVNGGLQRVAA